MVAQLTLKAWPDVHWYFDDQHQLTLARNACTSRGIPFSWKAATKLPPDDIVNDSAEFELWLKEQEL